MLDIEKPISNCDTRELMQANAHIKLGRTDVSAIPQGFDLFSTIPTHPCLISPLKVPRFGLAKPNHHLTDSTTYG